MARPRRSEPSREAVLDVGLQLFCELGYHGAGLQAILAEAGVPKGSFYNYFESKEEFAAAVVRRYAEALAERIDAEVLTKRDALAALRRFLHGQARAYRERGYSGGCLIGNLGAELEECDACRAALAEALDTFRGRVALALARAQEKGDVRSDRDAHELAGVLVDAWEGALIRAKLERSSKPLSACIAHLLDDHFRPRPGTD